MKRKKIVVFSGAGISKESGIPTFREEDGVWNNYKVDEVATLKAWSESPEKVIDFCNSVRENVVNSKPNGGHMTLVELEDFFDVEVVTQNVDDLHERAGSRIILHLHGEIVYGKSSKHSDDSCLEKIDGNMSLGDLASDGSQLKPHVVLFGEMVPNLEIAEKIFESADILIVVGTSLQVFPVANLIYNLKSEDIPIYIVDPGEIKIETLNPVVHIKERAKKGMKKLFNILTKGE